MLRHQLIDPATKKKIRGSPPLRLQQRRQMARSPPTPARENITKIHTGLAALQAKLLRGHPQCTIASITRQVVQLLGKKDAARYLLALRANDCRACAILPGRRRTLERLTDMPLAQTQGTQSLAGSASDGHQAPGRRAVYPGNQVPKYDLREKAHHRQHDASLLALRANDCRA